MGKEQKHGPINGVLVYKIGTCYEILEADAKVVSRLLKKPYGHIKNGVERLCLHKDSEMDRLSDVLHSLHVSYCVISKMGLEDVYYGAEKNYDRLAEKADTAHKPKDKAEQTHNISGSRIDASSGKTEIKKEAVKPRPKKKKRTYSSRQVRLIKDRMKRDKVHACILTGVITACLLITACFIVEVVRSIDKINDYQDVYRRGQFYYEGKNYEAAKTCFESIPDDAGFRTDIYLARIEKKEVEKRCKDIGSWHPAFSDENIPVYQCPYCGAAFNALEDKSFPYAYCPKCGKNMKDKKAE